MARDRVYIGQRKKCCKVRNCFYKSITFVLLTYRINRSERWISANEIYLNNIKSSLKNSVNLIKKEFSKYDSKAASDSSLLQQVDESSL